MISYDVFLSYNSKDKADVEWIARRLRDDYGLKVWLDKWNLIPGEPWQEELEEALDDSEPVAVFLGPSGIGPWENEEIRAALHARLNKKHLRVIPVLLPGAPDPSTLRLPAFLARLTWVDLRDGLEDKGAMYVLVTGIKGVPPGDAVPESHLPAPASIPELSLPGSEPTGVLRDEVAFRAIYPRRGIVERWYTLLVYAHLLSALDDVRNDAQRFKDQIPAPKEVTSSASTLIARGIEMTIVPSCEGLVFNPERVTVKWMEDYHRAEFRLRANSSLAFEIARGTINIYVGPIIVGSIYFTMPFRDTDTHSDREEWARMYHQEEIFVSYSHKDSEVVLACKKAYDALGFNVLIDRDNLRSGQVWNEELMRMVDRATIFQLFWSENSRQSKYCRQEWEHALKQNKGGGFIRPVYWEIPMPEPPEELSRYHFEYLELLPKRSWWSSLLKRGR